MLDSAGSTLVEWGRQQQQHGNDDDDYGNDGYEDGDDNDGDDDYKWYHIKNDNHYIFTPGS